MAVSAEFAAHVRDLFGGLGPIDIRRMFGGAGIYLGDAMFGLIYEDGLIYMRGDAGQTRRNTGRDRRSYVDPACHQPGGALGCVEGWMPFKAMWIG